MRSCSHASWGRPATCEPRRPASARRSSSASTRRRTSRCSARELLLAREEQLAVAGIENELGVGPEAERVADRAAGHLHAEHEPVMLVGEDLDTPFTLLRLA